MTPEPGRTPAMAATVIALALFVLLGAVVYMLRAGSGADLAVVLSAIGTVVAALPAVLLAVTGRERRRR